MFDMPSPEELMKSKTKLDDSELENMYHTLMHWRAEPPTVPGIYFFTCAESNVVEQLKVYNSDLGLLIDCPNMGKGMLLDAYHNGLTYPMWSVRRQRLGE